MGRQQDPVALVLEIHEQLIVIDVNSAPTPRKWYRQATMPPPLAVVSSRQNCDGKQISSMRGTYLQIHRIDPYQRGDLPRYQLTPNFGTRASGNISTYMIVGESTTVPIQVVNITFLGVLPYHGNVILQYNDEPEAR